MKKKEVLKNVVTNIDRRVKRWNYIKKIELLIWDHGIYIFIKSGVNLNLASRGHIVSKVENVHWIAQSLRKKYNVKVTVANLTIV